MNKKEKIEYGLVLAGGGTRGAYQVGAWKAIQELNIDVKCIVRSINRSHKWSNVFTKFTRRYRKFI